MDVLNTNSKIQDCKTKQRETDPANKNLRWLYDVNNMAIGGGICSNNPDKDVNINKVFHFLCILIHGFVDRLYVISSFLSTLPYNSLVFPLPYWLYCCVCDVTVYFILSLRSFLKIVGIPQLVCNCLPVRTIFLLLLYVIRVCVSICFYRICHFQYKYKHSHAFRRIFTSVKSSTNGALHVHAW